MDGEEVTNGDSTASPVGGRLGSACVPSSGMVFLLDGVSLSSTGFEVRCLFDGVDGARPSQRDRFGGGVVVGVGIAVPEFGLGK